MVILIAVAFLPVAIATAIVGEIALRGPMTLPPGALVDAPLHALFSTAVTDDLQLFGTFPTAHVTVMEVHYASVPIGPLRPSLAIDDRRPEWDLHDLALTASSSRAGWLGLQSESGNVQTRPSQALKLSPVADPELGNAATVSADQDAEHAYFHAKLDGLALKQADASWTFDGSGSLKLLGPVATMRARENTTTIETGEFEDPERPGQLLRRWIQIDFDQGSIAAECQTDIITPSARASWDGEASLERAAGEIQSDGRAWIADGDETIAGRLESRMTPNEAGGFFQLAVEGELSHTSMVVRAPEGPLVGGFPTLLAGLVGVVLAGGATWLVTKFHRRHGVHLNADEYAHLADEAADADDYARAAHFAREARNASPTSRRLALDHAYYCMKAGRREEALGILADRLLAESADARLLQSRLLIQTDANAAAIALTRALELAPVLVFDVEGDAELDALFQRSDITNAVRQAYARLR